MFITLEGGEGAGKSTQIVHLAGIFNERGIECVLTREPGGTSLGKKIRALLLHPENAGMAPEAELLLYMADRAEHVSRIIRPALADGKAVLCDRFFDATVVYQGAVRGLDIEWAARMHQLTFPGLIPDLTLLLDLPPEQGLIRAQRQLEQGGRPAQESRFENEHLDFHRRVREGYLMLASREPGRFRLIDAAQDENRVRRDIRTAIESFLIRR